MNQITANLRTGGQTKSRINYKKASVLAQIMRVSKLLGAGAVGGVSLVMLHGLINNPGRPFPTTVKKPVLGNVGVAVKAAEPKASWWSKAGSGVASSAKNVFNFGKSAVVGAGRVVYNVGKGAIKATGDVISVIKTEISPGGRFEGVWKAVVTTTKIISAAAFTVCAIVSIPATGPVGVLGAVYGLNSLIGAGADAWNIDQGNYDKVGKVNPLKTTLQKTSEIAGAGIGTGVGYLVGGAEGAKTGATIGKATGSVVGTLAYEAGKIYTGVKVGSTVISDSNDVYSKMKDVMKIANASKAYGYTEKAVKWINNPAEEVISVVVPKGMTETEEMVEKATKKIIEKIVKPIKVE
jgi:hypothetical protein